MRALIVTTLALVSGAAVAQPGLLFGHMQHIYAGGGGCIERFWLEWQGSNAEITDIEILLELKSESDETLSSSLHLGRLGVTASDRAAEASVETPRCLSGSPSIVIRKAFGAVKGKRINLLETHWLQLRKVTRYPLSIGSGGPTIHSTRPARQAAQAGEFQR